MSVRVCVCVVMVLLVAAGEEDLDSREGRSCKQCEEVKIPLEMALRLNTISDENQLFREFIQGNEKPVIQKARFPLLGFSPDSVESPVDEVADEPVERKAVSRPKPAGCVPELRSVSLQQSKDPWIYYWPSCTRVEQCGGCCSHQLLSCQPIEVEMVNFKVVVTEYAGNNLVFKGNEIVTVEKHTKCRCDCITKEKDCNPLQEYRKAECRCVCANRDAEAKCIAENHTRHWNSENCSCDCLNVFECSTGTYFSHSTCSCEALPDETLLDRFAAGSSDPANSSLSQSPPRRRWPINYFFGSG